MSTTTHFIALLPETEFDDFNRKMTENNMDFRKLCGEKTYLLFKKVCENEMQWKNTRGVSINPNPNQSTSHRRIIAPAQMRNKPRIHNTTRSNPNSKPWNPPSNRCLDEEQEPRI